MTFKSGAFSPDEFSSTAESFGYRYKDLAFTSSMGGRETPLFEGLLGLQSLPCGISLCASDLMSRFDSEHRGAVGRSLTSVVLMDGDRADCVLGDDKELFFGPPSASVVSVADSALLTGRYKAGQRSRCLLVRARPDDMSDDAVAEQLESRLGGTAVKPMAMSHRAMRLAEELISPVSQGPVGRLLAESCALEFLARALQTDMESVASSAARLSRRDYVKILRVRDMLMSEPGRDFTLGEIAGEAGMSVTVLKAKFSAAFGQPVFAFLRDVRMQRAKDGLENQGWTVSQAAYFVGYRHPTNFSTAFRRKFGFAPKDLRQG